MRASLVYSNTHITLSLPENPEFQFKSSSGKFSRCWNEPKARKQDLDISARYNTEKTQPVLGKRAETYIEPGSDDEADNNEPEMLPPSKHPRLSKEATIPDKQSPAANNGSRTEFLRRLVKDPVLWILLHGVQALPGFVSFFSGFIGEHLSNYIL